jgi:hypothetical protein
MVSDKLCCNDWERSSSSRTVIHIALHSSKLLLALASTVILGFVPRRKSLTNFSSFQDHSCVWKWDLLFDERRGWSFWVGAKFFAPNSIEVYPQSHSFQVRVFIFNGHHTHFVTITYLLKELWALLEKPPIVQPLKNFPAFYGTRRFITVFTRALQWSLSW